MPCSQRWLGCSTLKVAGTLRVPSPQSAACSACLRFTKILIIAPSIRPTVIPRLLQLSAEPRPFGLEQTVPRVPLAELRLQLTNLGEGYQPPQVHRRGALLEGINRLVRGVLRDDLLVKRDQRIER